MFLSDDHVYQCAIVIITATLNDTDSMIHTHNAIFDSYFSFSVVIKFRCDFAETKTQFSLKFLRNHHDLYLQYGSGFCNVVPWFLTSDQFSRMESGFCEVGFC